MGILSLTKTYFLMPKRVIPYELPANYDYGIKQCCQPSITETENELLLDNHDNGTSTINSVIENDQKDSEGSLKTCILNSVYLLALFSSTIQELRVDYFTEALNSWLQYFIPNKPGLISCQISFYGYVQMCALVLTPINGLIFDRLYSRFSKHSGVSPRQASLKSLSIVCLICSSSTILYSIFNLIPSVNLQYVTFILTVVSNSFVSANAGLLIIQCFPMKYFGILVGISLFCWALATPLQYLLYYIAIHIFKGSFLVVNAVMLVLSISTLIHPWNLHRCSK